MGKTWDAVDLCGIKFKLQCHNANDQCFIELGCDLALENT